MPIYLNSIVTLTLIILVARIIKRHSKILQRYYIPSSLVAGAIGLVLGPQIINAIPEEITVYWGQMPQYLITIVFAGLFLGKYIPSAKQVWRMAGPMIAFGNTIAWGQYVVGILLAMFVLTPFFGANPLVGTLIEMSFEGGHGTAAGLAPTFERLGWPEGTDIALGIATLSIIAAIASGVILINIYSRKKGDAAKDATAILQEKKNLIKSGYNLTTLTRKLENHPKEFALHILLFAFAIAIGWAILQMLIWIEELLLEGMTDFRFFTHIPLFPLAMIGGLVIQLFLKKINKQKNIDRKIVNSFSGIALDFLIASALATVSLYVIGDNFSTFLILSIAGIVWILSCFLLLAPRMFVDHWFEKGITNTGQSMGMTATGLLMNRLIDPNNKTKARESFAYKQLIFEPFMGGGLVTAIAPIVIFEFGSLVALGISLFFLLFWLVVGLMLPKMKRR